eukprot:SAG11_NODE_192_length_12931_cov_5.747682_7_plen_91_part_00
MNSIGCEHAHPPRRLGYVGLDVKNLQPLNPLAVAMLDPKHRKEADVIGSLVTQVRRGWRTGSRRVWWCHCNGSSSKGRQAGSARLCLTHS